MSTNAGIGEIGRRSVSEECGRTLTAGSTITERRRAEPTAAAGGSCCPTRRPGDLVALWTLAEANSDDHD